ncbi:unnamed protein product [Periconia digitata]|uniref:Uncharacterized protein n=1 Tax=Periconia digitata TaxID=1303443 RepID=A0A9W4UC46_9PLEO|nr:unnamed protein product [Periconia digitata]
MISSSMRHRLSSKVPVCPRIACRGASHISRNSTYWPRPLSPAKAHPDLHEELSKYLLRTSFPQSSKTRQHFNSKLQFPTKHDNMAFLLPGLRRTLILSTPLILSAPLLARVHRQPILCEGPDPFTKITSDLKNDYAQNAQTPIIKTSGAPNPRALRQVSLGSILGVLAGLGVSVFSKPLAILIGLGIVCVQFLESRGVHIVPYSYLQRRFKQTNVRSLMQNNVAFKLSFGATFALAAFAEF